jgi:putative sterol carrier protein
MANEQTGDVGVAQQPPRGGAAPGLAGVRGRLRIEAGGKAVGVLTVDDGRVELGNDSEPVDATLVLATADDLKHLVRGELNPVICALQGRLQLKGNTHFATKVALGLRAGSPFVSGSKKEG